jgi:hypothetical protein
MSDFNAEVFCSNSFDNTTAEAGVCAAFDAITETNDGLDTFYLLFAASFVFFMQTGFAVSDMFYFDELYCSNER